MPLHLVDRAVLRQRIIAVPQDPVFLPGSSSVRSNLDPFGVSTDDTCREVLETVQLWTFISDRGGLDAPLSADVLSQGQKQLFSLAQAVLRRRIRARESADINSGEKEGTAPASGGILLIDEISSSVDQDTDKHMQDVILCEFKEYTTIMISHRLDMAMQFDTIVVMEQGGIIETGTPQALVQSEGTRFREMWLASS